jgi:D-alanyl-D-alanine carboxypeptidase
LDNYKPSEIITISALADLQSPIKQDVFYGQRISSQDLLKLMIIGSSNKAAYALAEKYGINNFIEAMNAKVKAIGLKNTFFDDVTGIGSKNVSTAKDISILAEYILKNYPQIAQISSEKEIVISMLGKIYNTDALLKEVPDAVCSKTGFTTDAKGCLLLVINGQSSGEYIINVVLGADDRFFEMKKLINAYKACN